MGKFLVICFFTSVAYIAIAQDHLSSPDSLLEKLNKNQPDSDKLNVLLKLGDFYLFKPNEFKEDLDVAITYFNQAKIIVDKLQSNKWQNRIWISMMNYYFEKHDYQNAKYTFDSLIRNFQKTGNKIQEAETYETYTEKLNYSKTDPAF
ncbi:hypothetical protein [Mucilaginibacter celer]|uniref:Tetratricopeptide repeat protein n=1 Tax=Mucilaginibacter celer TaxID=2305508 RepID=A0A494W2T2_9SPHI|nr:hypothetical protein [Mucilaginibacter celer]AYL97592.1 hypothetical protein HYN43_020860 [Mucilaginibacter celer]